MSNDEIVKGEVVNNDEEAYQAPLFEMVAQPIDTDDKETLEASRSSALATFGTDVDFGAEDMSIPRIKLAQQMTQEVADELAKPGQFVCTGFDPMDAITLIPLRYARRRIYINPDSSEVECRSNDALEGFGNPGGACESCIMNQWTGDGASRKPPVCAFMYSYIVYVAEWQTIGIFDFKRTNLNAGKVVNTIAARKGLGKFAVRISGTKQTNKSKQTYYSMNVRPIEVDPAEFDTAEQMFGG